MCLRTGTVGRHARAEAQGRLNSRYVLWRGPGPPQTEPEVTCTRGGFFRRDLPGAARVRQEGEEAAQGAALASWPAALHAREARVTPSSRPGVTNRA